MPESLNQQIGRLKDEWRTEFRQIRVQITQLQARQDELRQKLNNADEILTAAKTTGKGKLPAVGGAKYSKMGATDAVRDFFSEHRFTRHNISEVTRHLQGEGFQSGSANVRDIVSITCRRLHKSDGFLDSTVQDGVRFFWVKNKTGLLKKEQAGAG
jgi:hypothetical protein